MGLVQRLFADLSQVLSDDLVLFGLVLELTQFLALAHQLNDVLQFHVLVYLLNVGS